MDDPAKFGSSITLTLEPNSNDEDTADQIVIIHFANTRGLRRWSELRTKAAQCCKLPWKLCGILLRAFFFFFIFIFCVMLLLEDGSRSLFSTKQGDVIVTSCKQWLSFIHKHPRSAWFLYWPVRWQTADNIIIQIKTPLYMNTIQFECYTNTRKITFLFEILKWNKCKQ